MGYVRGACPHHTPQLHSYSASPLKYFTVSISASIGRAPQEAEYMALLAAQEAVIAALQDGAPTTAAADAAVKVGTHAMQTHQAMRHAI